VPTNSADIGFDARTYDMKPPRVLVADYHPIVIEGLRRVLEPEFEIAGEVTDGRALVATFETLQPDIIIAVRLSRKVRQPVKTLVTVLARPQK
jgi:DNA-binding NarL/FixJ family response regulator